MERKEKVEEVFFMKEPTGIIETEDQGWLTQMANEGDIHAALILIDGMNHNYHCWDEDYINEDTNETVTVKRCEVVEGTIFPFDKALQTRLLKMIFDAKEQMSDEELAIVSNLLNGLYIDFMPIVNERIRRGDDTVAVPMEVLMDELVGSKYYEGNLLFMNTDDPERIVLRVEANDLKPLRYALLQKFPSLKFRLKKWEC